jgi:shikimate dehydrogenase
MTAEANAVGLHCTGTTRLFPIVGDPLDHVRAPSWFSAYFQERGMATLCVPMAVTPPELSAAISGLGAAKNVDGVCITMPHKTCAAAFCKTLSPTSQRTGMVSALRRKPDGSWHGHSTDGEAFLKALTDHGATIAGADILLLGAGGAGSAIAVALLEAGAARLAIFDTEKARTQDLIRRLDGLPGMIEAVETPDPSAFQVICNATPLGLEADDEPPLALDLLHADLFVGDVIAGVEETPLIAAARARGCATADGDAMVRAVLDIMTDFLAEAWRS